MPITFFEEGAEDRERKIADLRSKHDARSSVEAFQIPKVDWEGFQKDPVGAGLDALQQTLQGVINRDAQRRQEQRAEALKVANELYAAHEAAGIERSEAEVADEFYKQTGISIYSVTRQHARIVGQGNGRIRGRKSVSDFNKRVDAGEFDDPVSFSAAWEAEIGKFDKEAGNDAQKQGYLEAMGKNRLALEEKVFVRGVKKRQDEAINTFATEITGAFDDAVTAQDGASGWTTFGATVAGSAADLRKANPGLGDEEIEQAYIHSVQQAIEDGKNLGNVDEMVDSILSSGEIRTPKSRTKLLEQKRLALDNYEASALDPSIEVKQDLEDMGPVMFNAYMQNGTWSDKEIEAYMKTGAGSTYARTKLAEMARAADTIRGSKKDVGEKAPLELKGEFLRLQMEGDTAGIAQLFTDNVLNRYAGDPWITSAVGKHQEMIRGKLTPASDAEKSFSTWLTSTAGLNLATDDPVFVKHQEDLQAKLLAAKGLTPVEASRIKNELQASIIAERDAKAVPGVYDWRVSGVVEKSIEATQVLVEIEKDMIEAEKDASTALKFVAAFNKLNAEDQANYQGGFTGPRGRDGQPTFVSKPTESPQRKQKREAAEQDAERAKQRLIDLEAERILFEEQRLELQRQERAVRGMSAPQRTTYMIFNGQPDGRDRTLLYS